VADLEDEELEAVAAAWHARREAARAEGFGYVQVVLNVGRGAGASLPHSHSQLFWLREPPPAVLEELPQLEHGSCALCAIVRDADEIAVRGNAVLLAAPGARAPYELLIASREHTAELGEEALLDTVFLVRDAIRRLNAAEGAVPLNAWLHEGGHWHVEVLPRLSVLAGLELGAGIYVNWLPPEDAAARLRS
jgi:UDPglucose--hexose-1-phosphate uridylyltransferase